MKTTTIGALLFALLPGASAVPTLGGFVVNEVPADTNFASGFLKVKIDGVDSYLPYYR